MSPRVRLLLILLGILAAIAALVYAAQTLDLVGMIVRAHAPPRH